MKTLLKKLTTTIALSAVCITTLLTPATAYAADTRALVAVDATTIDVTITPDITVRLFPDQATKAVANSISIQNNSVAPIKVTLTGITPESDDFNIVSPDKYPDWSILNKSQSKDIAFQLTPDAGWKAATQNYRTGTADNFVGTLDPSAVGMISLGTVYHGLSYAGDVRSVFTFSFALELE
jgi:hypothetical protein